MASTDNTNLKSVLDGDIDLLDSIIDKVKHQSLETVAKPGFCVECIVCVKWCKYYGMFDEALAR